MNPVLLEKTVEARLPTAVELLAAAERAEKQNYFPAEVYKQANMIPDPEKGKWFNVVGPEGDTKPADLGAVLLENIVQQEQNIRAQESQKTLVTRVELKDASKQRDEGPSLG